MKKLDLSPQNFRYDVLYPLYSDLNTVSFPKQINAIMPRSGNVEKYYSEKEGKMPTKESHNGDKHATNVLLNSSFSL